MTQNTMATRERTKWNEILIVLPSDELPSVDGTLFDPAHAIHKRLNESKTIKYWYWYWHVDINSLRNKNNVTIICVNVASDKDAY